MTSKPMWINPNCSECLGSGRGKLRDDSYNPPDVCAACLAWASANGIQIPTNPGVDWVKSWDDSA